ncbi:MAG: phosphotransferase [Chloroflexota bacterium]
MIHELTSFVGSLRNEAGLLYPAPMRWMMAANGAADLNDSVIFFGFEWNASDPSLVVKAPRVPHNDWMLQIEYERLTELWNLLGSSAARCLPRPVAFTRFGTQSFLMLSYLEGESLTRAARGTLWRDIDHTKTLAIKAARSLRFLDDGTACRLEADDLALSDFRSKAQKFQEMYELSEKEKRGLDDLVELVNQQYAQASHKILLQGDFWHGNMIRDEKHDELKFVDWQFSRWSVDASLDVYLFIMAGAFTVGRRQGGENVAKAVADRLSAWRSDLIPAYLEAYGRPESFVLLPLRYGMLSCCVEKTIRSEVEFGYRHPDDLVWRSLFTELLAWPKDD